ncbi:MAG: hypothetical protein QNJ48_07600 [Desulfobacterales bacterium]|nr:hypothetical protein [Desulfobacterales bacterium]MDJ0876345.1 hypothetical protein [Desulfobacterales bacterium]MDJ0884009.1 hypothetical protein [Desulfobacterales bacterium]
MRQFIEQRRTERYTCESPLVCSILNGTSVYSGRSINHCERGMAFITQEPMKSGTTIYFRTDSFAQKRFKDSTCRGMRGMGLAQVRWCHPVANQASTAYQIGAEYVGPYP